MKVAPGHIPLDLGDAITWGCYPDQQESAEKRPGLNSLCGPRAGGLPGTEHPSAQRRPDLLCRQPPLGLVMTQLTPGTGDTKLGFKEKEETTAKTR